MNAGKKIIANDVKRAQEKLEFVHKQLTKILKMSNDQELSKDITSETKIELLKLRIKDLETVIERLLPTIDYASHILDDVQTVNKMMK